MAVTKWKACEGLRSLSGECEAVKMVSIPVPVLELGLAVAALLAVVSRTTS